MFGPCAGTLFVTREDMSKSSPHLCGELSVLLQRLQFETSVAIARVVIQMNARWCRLVLSRRHGLVAYGAVIPSWWSATITNNAEGPKCTRLFPDLSIPGVPRLRRRSAICRKTLK